LIIDLSICLSCVVLFERAILIVEPPAQARVGTSRQIRRTCRALFHGLDV